MATYRSSQHGKCDPSCSSPANCNNRGKIGSLLSFSLARLPLTVSVCSSGNRYSTMYKYQGKSRNMLDVTERFPIASVSIYSIRVVEYLQRLTKSSRLSLLNNSEGQTHSVRLEINNFSILFFFFFFCIENDFPAICILKYTVIQHTVLCIIHCIVRTCIIYVRGVFMYVCIYIYYYYICILSTENVL